MTVQGYLVGYDKPHLDELTALLEKTSLESVTPVADLKELRAVLEKAKNPSASLIVSPITLQKTHDGIHAAAEHFDTCGAHTLFTTTGAKPETIENIGSLSDLGIITLPIQETQAKMILQLAIHQIEDEAANEKTTPGDEIKLDQDNMFRRLPPFNRLPAEVQIELSTLSEAKEVSAGTQLAEEQAEDVLPFIPLKGRVALRKIGLNGKSLINHYLIPGDIFQVILSLQDGPFPFSAKVERDSTLLYLPKANLQTVLFENPYLYENFNTILHERLQRAEEMVRAIAYDKVEERIALILSLMIGSISRYDRKKGEQIIDLTRQELSDLTGTTTETAIRVTKALEQEGILDLSESSHIRILNLEALEEKTSSLLLEAANE